MKLIYFSKTIAAYDLKVCRCIELNDLINQHEYQRSRSFFDLCQRSLFSNLNIVFSKTVEIFETKYHVKDFGSTGMKIYTNGLGSMTKMGTMPINGKQEGHEAMNCSHEYIGQRSNII